MGHIVNKPHFAYRSQINVLTHQSTIGRPFSYVILFFPLRMTGRSKLLVSKGTRLHYNIQHTL